MTNQPLKNEMEKMKAETTDLSLSNWQATREMCATLVKSGFLPTTVNTPEKAIAIALAGKELGIGMMESFRSINVILGRPTVSPQLMLALANRKGELEDIQIDSDDKRCIVTVKRKGRTAHTEEFGVKEASSLGLMSKDNYKKQASVMFRWRALAANLRVTFPDVVLGLYTPEELGADDVEPSHINAQASKSAVKLEDVLQDSVKTSVNGHQSVEESEIVESPVEMENDAIEPVETPKTQDSSPKISEKQQKMLFARTKAYKLEVDTVKQHLQNTYGIEHSSELTRGQFQEVLEWLETQKR
jgi:hypothetical protein